jgi:hypothetical protein
MNATPIPSAIWQFDGRFARLSCAGLEANVDVLAPRRGLAQLTYRGGAVGGWLLGLDVDAEPGDVYVRGDDLVVAYRETPARPFSVQVYWSAAARPAESAVVLDATVSVQTRAWETSPRIVTSSSLDGADVAAVTSTVMLARPRAVDWSYAEVAPAEDFAPIADVEDGAGNPSAAMRWAFREQFMERGVIRRLRLRGVLVPRVDDVAAATRLRDALLAEQPPLTA